MYVLPCLSQCTVLADNLESERQKLAIQRYQVKTVHEGHYSNEKNQTQPEKVRLSEIRRS